MKLWQKEDQLHPLVETFTTGNDPSFDLLLAESDILGSIAHATMLCRVGLIMPVEKDALLNALRTIHRMIAEKNFSIAPGTEDVHSQIEFMLTELVGDAGKKIHTARSRNDQALLDIKLFIRTRIRELVKKIELLFFRLMELSQKHRDVLLPGYTHLQVAMPSSFGLWFAAYAESLSDDLDALLAAYRIADRNPLGSAAGYGSSFPVDRELTTMLLGFSGMNVNSVYAQMTRGKTEKAMASAMAAIASTAGRFAMDCTLYMSQNFGFISFPSGLTTGSSIMPHKKNPDVWELVRGHCNRIQSLPGELALLTANLPSGYHRDLQLTKEILFPAMETLEACLETSTFMLEHIIIRKNILDSEEYDALFTLEAVNTLVRQGVPFRDAYREIGREVEEKRFTRPAALSHTHTGSIGNTGNDLVQENVRKQVDAFQFERAEAALAALLNV